MDGGYWNGTGVAGGSLLSEDSSSGKRDLSETGTFEGCGGLIVELCAGAPRVSRPSEKSSSLNPDILLTVSNCHAFDCDDKRLSGLLDGYVTALTKAGKGRRTGFLHLPNQVDRRGWSLYRLPRSRRRIERAFLSE